MPRSPWKESVKRAAKQGDASKLKELFEGGANPNFFFEGTTPLSMACSAMNGAKAAIVLLEAGADPNLAQEGRNAGALLAAARKGDARLVEALLSYGANPLVESLGALPLHSAAQNGNYETMRVLADKSLYGGEWGRALRELLHSAVFGRNRSAVRLALDMGANPDERNSGGRTALHWAAGYGEGGLVQEILNGGASPNLKLHDGGTALDLLAHSDNCNEECLLIMLSGGCEFGVGGEDFLDKPYLEVFKKWRSKSELEKKLGSASGKTRQIAKV